MNENYFVYKHNGLAFTVCLVGLLINILLGVIKKDIIESTKLYSNSKCTIMISAGSNRECQKKIGMMLVGGVPYAGWGGGG